MRFSTKSMLVIVGSIATILGLVLAVERGFQPNPDSEEFYVQGKLIVPHWTTCNWRPASTGVRSSPAGTTRNFRGSCDVNIRQNLFTYSYNDHFGNRAFVVNCELVANFNNDWSQFNLDPVFSGGGNTNTGALIHYDLDIERESICIAIRQSFNSIVEAKKIELVFVWNGKFFEFQNR